MALHYIDAGEIFSIYGVISLIFVIMLLWYFVRSNLEYENKFCVHGLKHCHKCHRREGMFPLETSEVLSYMPEFKVPDVVPEEQTDDYKLIAGTYGDVPLYMYDLADVSKAKQFNTSTGIYIPNMRTSFRNSYLQ